MVGDIDYVGRYILSGVLFFVFDSLCFKLVGDCFLIDLFGIVVIVVDEGVVMDVFNVFDGEVVGVVAELCAVGLITEVVVRDEGDDLCLFGFFGSCEGNRFVLVVVVGSKFVVGE